MPQRRLARLRTRTAAATSAAACAAELAEVKCKLTRTTAQNMHEVKRSVRESVDLQLGQAWGMWQDRARNPLTARPRRYWSQSDEDGILAEILLRLPAGGQTFLEFGVDDGRENNTMALLAQRWRGVWVGAQELAFDPVGSPRLRYLREWVTLASLPGIVAQVRAVLGSDSPTVLSLDLDGNDYHFTEALLESGVLPDVWVGEYNGRIPVGAEWFMPYLAEAEWSGPTTSGCPTPRCATCWAVMATSRSPAACRARTRSSFERNSPTPSQMCPPTPVSCTSRRCISSPTMGYHALPETLQSIVHPPN